MPPQVGSSSSTCQNWDLYDCCPREERTFIQDIWPLPSSLLLTGDSSRAVLCIEEPLTAMTTGPQNLGNQTAIICRADYASPQKADPTIVHCRKLEPQDPWPLAQTPHCGHTDLKDLDVEPGHTGIHVHHAPSSLSTMGDLLGQRHWHQPLQSLVGTAACYPWNPDVSAHVLGLPASGSLTVVWPIYHLLLEAS